MSFLGTIGNIVSAVGNVVTGGALGTVERTIQGFLPQHNQLVKTQPAMPSPVTPVTVASVLPVPSLPSSTPGSVPVPGFTGALERFLPGGATGYTGAYAGYHVNKRYAAFVRGSQMGKHLQDPTKASQVVNPVVKNRKMNPLNPRALRRAVAREHAAVRLMRRAMRGTGYHISRAGFGGRKTRRR